MARTLVERFERSVLVEGDAFFGFLRRGAIPPWHPAAKAQNAVVIESAASAAGHYSRSGFSVVYDGVIGRWFLPAFLAATGLDALDYVILLPTVDRCVARVVTREGTDSKTRGRRATCTKSSGAPASIHGTSWLTLPRTRRRSPSASSRPRRQEA